MVESQGRFLQFTHRDVQDRTHPLKTQLIYLSISPTYIFHITLPVRISALGNSELSLFFKVLHQTEKYPWKTLCFLNWNSWAFTHEAHFPLLYLKQLSRKYRFSCITCDFVNVLVTMSQTGPPKQQMSSNWRQKTKESTKAALFQTCLLSFHQICAKNFTC